MEPKEGREREGERAREGRSAKEKSMDGWSETGIKKRKKENIKNQQRTRQRWTFRTKNGDTNRARAFFVYRCMQFLYI